MATDQQIITDEIIDESISYSMYRDLINDQLKQGKTTGTKQADALTAYTRNNVDRMNQIEESVELKGSLKSKLLNLSIPWIWLVLTEGWCGDAAESVPIIHKMAAAASNVELKLLLRTENQEIMDQYLTNGGRSIPKLICLHAETLDEIGTWGPRPGDFQKTVMEWKHNPNISQKKWIEKLHHWYEEDHSQTIQKDFEQLLDKWNSAPITK